MERWKCEVDGCESSALKDEIRCGKHVESSSQGCAVSKGEMLSEKKTVYTEKLPPVRKKGQQINRVHIRFKTERKAKYRLTSISK